MEQAKPNLNAQNKNIQIEVLNVDQNYQAQPLVYDNNNNYQPMYVPQGNPNNNIYNNYSQPSQQQFQPVYQGQPYQQQQYQFQQQQQNGFVPLQVNYGEQNFFNDNRPIVVGIPVQQYQVPYQQNMQVAIIPIQVQEKLILESRLRRAARWNQFCNVFFFVLVVIQLVQFIERAGVKKRKRSRDGEDDDYYYDEEDDDYHDGENDNQDSRYYLVSNKALRASAIIGIVTFSLWVINLIVGQYAIYKFNAKLIDKTRKTYLFILILDILSLITMIAGFKHFKTGEKAGQVIFYIITFFVLGSFYSKAKQITGLIELYESSYGNFHQQQVSNNHLQNQPIQQPSQNFSNRVN